MANQVILDAVESLIGGEIFANPVYNTRPKVPKVAAGAVPWHQDKSYGRRQRNPVITVWVPLVDATLENGCLHVMPRTPPPEAALLPPRAGDRHPLPGRWAPRPPPSWPSAAWMNRFWGRCSARVYASDATMPATDFPAANLETEFAIRTLAELPPRRAEYEPADLAAVSELLAAFDLTQSCYSVAPDDLSEIADSGNSGGAVFGTPIPNWRDRDLTRTTVELSVDGGAPVPTYSGNWRRHPPGRIHLAGKQPQPARHRPAGGSGGADRLAYRSASGRARQPRPGALRPRRRSAHVHRQ